MTSNLQRGRIWRENVAMYLKLVTGLHVTMKPIHQKLSEAVMDDDRRDIRGEGLDNWHLRVRSEASRDLSGALDEAAEEAAESGRFPAVIWHRQGRRAGESYVVMSLHTLGKLLTPPPPKLANGTKPKPRLQDLL